MKLYIKPFPKYGKPNKISGGISNICAPTLGIPGRDLFFINKSPKTLNTMFFNVFDVLQKHFWTRIGYIDADQKVSMTQFGLFFGGEPKLKNM